MGFDQFYSYTLPITHANVATAVAASLAMPVTIMQNETSQSYPFYEQHYKNITTPVKVDFVSKIKSKIEATKRLKTNWDGYGAEAPAQKTITNSLQFIETLPEFILSDINTENVTPTPYGTIVIDFEKNDNLLSIEIGESQIGFFSEFTDQNDLSLDKTTFNPANLPVEMVDAFNKLYV